MLIVDLIGPVNTISMILILVVSGLCISTFARDRVLIGSALLLSWIGAQAATFTDQIAIVLVSISVAALMCILAGTIGALCIAFIYGIRLFIAAFALLDFFPVWVMWESAFIIVPIQLVLALGTFIDGGKAIPSKNSVVSFAYRMSTGLNAKVRYFTD